MTRGRCEETAGEPAAATGRVLLVKKIIMKDGAGVGARPAIFTRILLLIYKRTALFVQQVFLDIDNQYL